MEALKAADVALCMLLRSYLCPNNESDPSPQNPLHARLGEALLRELRRRDEAASPTLLELMQRVEDHVSPQGLAMDIVATSYVGAMKDSTVHQLSSMELPDDLISFFGSLADSVITQCTSAPAECEGQGADASSTMGLFLRLCYARYTAMSFESLCKLLGEVHAYVDVALAVLDRQQPAPAANQPAALRSAAELDRYLNSQLADLEQRLGRLPQSVIEAPLAEVEAAAAHLPKATLGRHLSSLHHRDFAASLDHLHRFFDHTVDSTAAGRGAGASGRGAPAQPAQEEGGSGGELRLRRLQSAALSLGAMHAQLGHMEEALQALNETVRIAQQSSDDTCLAHALALLCQVLDATTPGTITSVSQAPGASPAARHYSQLGQLLRRCLTRSEELHVPHLVALSRLALARLELMHPQQSAGGGAAGSESTAGINGGSSGSGSSSQQPCSSSAAVAGALRDVAHLSLAACLAAAAPSVPPLSSGASSARVLRGLGDLFTATSSLFAPNMQGMHASSAAEVERLAAAAHLLQSSCWELRGSRHLAQAHALACLDAHADVARAEDQCTALAQLATSLAATHGYLAAQQLLAVVDERFPHSQSRLLAFARLAIAHDRALNRRDLHAAMDLAGQMAALASPTDSTDITLRLEAEERVARTLLAAGRAEDAAAAAHTMSAVAARTGQPLHSARLLLLLARVHQQAGAPLAALPYALSAVVHARQLHADMLAAEAAVVVAGLWCDMGAQHAQHAQRELEAVLPAILAHGSLQVQAAAQVALAEAVMAQHDTPAGLQQDAEWVLGLLEEAERVSMQLEDRQGAAHCTYLRALVQDALGQEQQRNADAVGFGALAHSRPE